MSEKKGLADTFACETKISSIIDEELAYAGYNIRELMESELSYEEVVFLLWQLHLPTAQELADFSAEINSHMEICGAVEATLRIQCRQNLHPMSVLRSTVSLLGVFDPLGEENSAAATRLQSINILAKMPTIVAAFSRLRRGLDPVKPRIDLGYAANFLYMLKGEEATATEVKAFNRALVLHADHELCASTFAARVCASTLSDVYSCITASIGTLKGSLHGGANERVFDMLVAINELGDAASYLQQKLADKEKIMGFGHRVYKKQDPRESFLKQMAYELTVSTENEKWYILSETVEEYMRKEKGIIPNVDFYSATVYHVLGIDSDLFTLLFSISRAAGWLAHVKEQQAENRLIRPRSLYRGAENLVFIPIEERA